MLKFLSSLFFFGFFLCLCRGDAGRVCVGEMAMGGRVHGLEEGCLESVEWTCGME